MSPTSVHPGGEVGPGSGHLASPEGWSTCASACRAGAWTCSGWRPLVRGGALVLGGPLPQFPSGARTEPTPIARLGSLAPAHVFRVQVTASTLSWIPPAP